MWLAHHDVQWYRWISSIKVDLPFKIEAEAIVKLIVRDVAAFQIAVEILFVNLEISSVQDFRSEL